MESSQLAAETLDRQMDMIEFVRSTRGNEWTTKWSESKFAESQMTVLDGLPNNMVNGFAKNMMNSLTGDPYYAMEDMIMLASKRAAQMTSIRSAADAFPKDKGVLFFGEPFMAVDAREEEYPVTSVSWLKHGDGIFLWFYTSVQIGDDYGTAWDLEQATDYFAHGGVHMPQDTLFHAWASIPGDQNFGTLGDPREWPLERRLNMGRKSFDAYSNTFEMLTIAIEVAKMLSEWVPWTSKTKQSVLPRNTVRRAKKRFEMIPEILIFSLRKLREIRQRDPNATPEKMEFAHSFDVEGHWRTYQRGTDDEFQVWIDTYRKAADKPYWPKERLGVLDR